MVLDSPAYHPPLHPEVFHADPQPRRGGRKQVSPPCVQGQPGPFLSSPLSPESDSSGPGRTKLPKVLRGLGAPPCLASQGPCSCMHRSESSCLVNRKDWARGQIRSAASLPHLPRARAEEGARRAGKRSPCLLVALRPANLEAEREQFFRSSFAYNPQFEYGESVPEVVLDKYREASGQFLLQVAFPLAGSRGSCPKEPSPGFLLSKGSCLGWMRPFGGDQRGPQVHPPHATGSPLPSLLR